MMPDAYSGGSANTSQYPLTTAMQLYTVVLILPYIPFFTYYLRVLSQALDLGCTTAKGGKV